MSTEDDDLIITIPDDDAEAGKDGKDPVARKGADDEHVGVAELRSQLERSQQESAAKDAQLTKAQQDAQRARQEITETQVDAVLNAIAAETQARDAAKRDYAAAMQDGDFDKAADAQERLTTAVTKLTTLERDKVEIDARKGNGGGEDRRQSSGDPVEDYISNFSPRAQTWLRQHKDCVTDKKQNLRMIAAHNEALADDIAPDSDKYYEFLETKLGLRQAPDEPAPRKEAQRRAADIAAPPSRTVPDGRGRQTGNKITLTRAEAEAADAMGVSRVDYAKNKLRAQQEGRM